MLGTSASAFASMAPRAAKHRPTLLDEPPQLFTFKLDDPSTRPLSLLESFHEIFLEHPIGAPWNARHYTFGAWARWRAQPWWKLSWSPSGRHDGTLFRPTEAETSLLDEPSPLTGLEPWAPQASGATPLFAFAPRNPEPPARPLTWTPEPPPLWSGLLPARSHAFSFSTTGPSLASNGFDALWSLPPSKPIPNWRCRRRPVRFVRYGGEFDAFPLVQCDGAVAKGALDRLTLMARVPEAPRPGELLPDEPDPEAAAQGEWVRGVRLVHPRLLWALQRIADAFPWRTIYVYSGYRPQAIVNDASKTRSGGHQSMHAEARAMDISIMGLPNAALFQVCRSLDDVGCGFYPNSKFVHVDIRRPGTGHAYWIDISGPGEPANYVDSWPGVVERGALSWSHSCDKGADR